MRRVRVDRGLDVVVPGRPAAMITPGDRVRTVALRGCDLPGLRPRLRVDVGAHVALGEVLLEDRVEPARVATAPGSGVVTHIGRGARRRLETVVIRLEGGDEVPLRAHDRRDLADLPRQEVVHDLLAAGLWTTLRRRPLGIVPHPDEQPAALFVTAIDTRPLAPDVEVIVQDARQPFLDGLAVLGRLSEGPLYLCRAPGSDVPGGDEQRVSVVEFEGPHPAGLPGTHIHALRPAGRSCAVWHVGYQDVIAVGRVFTSGRPDAERIVALAGPCVPTPRLVRTRRGAALGDLLRGEVDARPVTTVAGCVLHGRAVAPASAWLGAREDTLAVLPRASVPPAAAPGPLVPLAAHERVFAFDLPAVPLLRALLAGDVERAVALGCLELDDEDLALSSYVCPSRRDYGALLRLALDTLVREGWA